MDSKSWLILYAALWLLAACKTPLSTNALPADFSPANTGVAWVQPTSDGLPIWGHPQGLQIGIAPTKGPRGLVRLYAPFLRQPAEKMLNFFAIEPIVTGSEQRGYSELETSTTDGKAGKVFTSSNFPARGDWTENYSVAKGVVDTVDGVERLTLFIHCEPFNNGAEVYLRVRFFADQPFEVELTTFTTPNSTTLDHLVLTATMGNYARLRELHLRDEVLLAKDIWPDYRGDHFTEHHVILPQKMPMDRSGYHYFIATTDEALPNKADYTKGTNRHWQYVGQKAVQYWKVAGLEPKAVGLVNGRFVYWASRALIPGGISYENFELVRPFRQGASFTFGVVAGEATTFIKTLNLSNVDSSE